MQDLPPPGGFGTINVDRTLPRPILRQSILLVLSIGVTLFGLNYIHEWRKRYRVLKIEQAEHYIATVPFLYAEQERKYLINLHKIREAERELMKDHPGWEVGTLYGEKLYKTMPKDFLPPVSGAEFAFGRSVEEWLYKVANMDFWK